MSELTHDRWTGTTYGNSWMHRWLIRSLRVIDVRLLYAFAYLFVVPPILMINRKATKAIYRFYRSGLRYGIRRSARMTYRNHCAFAEVVIDRFAMYAGKRFRITIDGYEQFEELLKAPSGFIQLSSHIGNYEIAGYSLVTEGKRLNALVFGGEKESVMKNRNRLFEKTRIRMIPMESDMSHLFVIDTALSNGEILSMPADRIFGSQKAFRIPFLGKTAQFPQGPFVLAAMRNTPMLFVAVMKNGAKHYHITVRKIAAAESGSTRERAVFSARGYVGLLEGIVREHPAQWYNYFDFWAE